MESDDLLPCSQNLTLEALSVKRTKNWERSKRTNSVYLLLVRTNKCGI